MKALITRIAATLALVVAFAAPALADNPPAWTRPQAPFRVVGSIYYVGSEGLAAYLIRTPKGAMLIDGTLPENAAMVEANITALGLRLHDVKILLLTHAHFDHAGALAKLRRDTGAKLYVGTGDRRAVETGRPHTENPPADAPFPATPVDGSVRDGERFTLGGVTLTAIATPGHTPGGMSYGMTVVEDGRTLSVVFPCSITVAGNKLVGNQAYPDIVTDYRRSFARLAATRADVVLTAHPEFSDVLQKHARAPHGGLAFVDPMLLPKLVSDASAQFEAALAKQQAVQ